MLSSSREWAHPLLPRSGGCARRGCRAFLLAGAGPPPTPPQRGAIATAAASVASAPPRTPAVRIQALPASIPPWPRSWGPRSAWGAATAVGAAVVGWGRGGGAAVEGEARLLAPRPPPRARAVALVGPRAAGGATAMRRVTADGEMGGCGGRWGWRSGWRRRGHHSRPGRSVCCRCRAAQSLGESGGERGQRVEREARKMAKCGRGGWGGRCECAAAAGASTRANGKAQYARSTVEFDPGVLHCR